jgi:uncharacterized C2H2 Zn-finger protein
MVASLLVGLGAVIVIVVVVWGVLALSARGKKLKCPDCGTVFSAPMMDQKISGVGWTFPYTGRIKCPKCGALRSRRDYQKAPASVPAYLKSSSRGFSISLTSLINAPLAARLLIRPGTCSGPLSSKR